MFIQWYGKLKQHLSYHLCQLYEHIAHHSATNHGWVVAYFGQFKQIDTKVYYLPSHLRYEPLLDSSDTDLLLAEIAMQLYMYNGNAYSFYEMLKFMKNPAVCSDEVRYLATEIRKNARKFNPLTLSDNSVSMHPYDGMCVNFNH